MSRKRLISILLSLALLICVFCGCIGCETKYSRNLKRIKETEYFRYINYEGEDTVTILELTELGKQQEVLVIPKEINGMKVEAIGTHRIKGTALGPQPGFSLTSKSLKKIYVQVNDEEYHKDDVFHRPLMGGSNLIVVFMSEDKSLVADMLYHGNYKYVIIKDGIVEIDKLNQEFEIPKKYIFANMIFNVHNERYWVDYIEDNGLYVIPPVPIENGKTFIGWFTDQEFQNAWNGEYIIPEGQEILNLYAKFQ